VNGVLAAPLMALMMLIVRKRRAMGRLTLPPGATIMGWGATLVMLAATAIFLTFILI
jgi:Mn2+/Fe2+ NRAMP family transporter